MTVHHIQTLVCPILSRWLDEWSQFINILDIATTVVTLYTVHKESTYDLHSILSEVDLFEHVIYY